MTEATPDELDQVAMAQLAAGEDARLDELMQRHAPRLFQYLVRILQNETEAEELTEEAFVRVYQNRARFKTGARFTTWLFTIATNLARDIQRRRSRHPHVSLEAEPPAGGQAFHETLPETRLHPAEALAAAEQAQAVRDAVHALPEDLRVPLVLAEYEDKSHAEIAAILDCSVKAVEMRVYRARLELRSRLTKWFSS